MVNENKTLSMEKCMEIRMLAKTILKYFSTIGLLEVNDQIIDMALAIHDKSGLIKDNKEARYLLESYIYFPNVEEFEKVYLEKGKNPILVASHFETQPSKVNFTVLAIPKYRSKLPAIDEEVVLETTQNPGSKNDTITFMTKDSKIAMLNDRYAELVEKNNVLRRDIKKRSDYIEQLKDQIKNLNAEYNLELFNRGIYNDPLAGVLQGDKREKYFEDYYIMTNYEFSQALFDSTGDVALEGDFELKSETASIETLCNMADVRNNRLKCLNLVLSRVIGDLEFDLTMLSEELKKYKTPEQMKSYEHFMSYPNTNLDIPWWGIIDDEGLDSGSPNPGSRK